MADAVEDEKKGRKRKIAGTNIMSVLYSTVKKVIV